MIGGDFINCDKTAILEMLRVSMQLLSEKKSVVNNYVFKTLQKVYEYISSFKPSVKYDKTKYFHRGVECINEIINTFGIESAYIYCVIQVYKHMYLYESDCKDLTEYQVAEFYRHIANDLVKVGNFNE